MILNDKMRSFVNCGKILMAHSASGFDYGHQTNDTALIQFVFDNRDYVIFYDSFGLRDDDMERIRKELDES